MTAAKRAPKCPKCEGTMEEGFLSDHRSRAIKEPAEWVEGAPERLLLFLGVKTAGREKLRVTAWRCTRCGYLEQYATGE